MKILRWICSRHVCTGGKVMQLWKPKRQHIAAEKLAQPNPSITPSEILESIHKKSVSISMPLRIINIVSNICTNRIINLRRDCIKEKKKFHNANICSIVTLCHAKWIIFLHSFPTELLCRWENFFSLRKFSSASAYAFAQDSVASRVSFAN